MDMISICEHKLDLQNQSKQKFQSSESTSGYLIYPLALVGILGMENKIEIIRTLSDTNFRKRALHLCLVTPDDLSDAEFIELRDIEKRM